MGTEAARPIRYALPPGDRFTIHAATAERITIGAEVALDVEVSFELDCEVVGEEAGDVVTLAGCFRSPRISGRAFSGLLPDLAALDGSTIRVRKGLDGRVHDVLDADPVERLFGGLTAANALNWFAACFPAGPVSSGDVWSVRDRWVLRADRTPIAVDLPLRPAVDVRYAYRLDGFASEDGRELAEIEVDVEFSGGGRSDVLGMELEASGAGRGRVTVDLTAGKLAVSRKEAILRLVPRPVRKGALALPAMRVQRRSEAGFRAP